MEQMVTQAELAHAASVSRTSARKAFNGKLKPVVSADGKRVPLAHPLVQAYLHSRHGHRQRVAAERIVQAAASPALPADFVDPFAVAARNAAAQQIVTTPAVALAPVITLADRREARTDQGLRDLHMMTAGVLPADLEDLGAMTLREVVDNFGTLQALGEAVKALKNFASMKVSEVDASKKRGDLVDRKLLTAVLLPIVEQGFKRLVGEVPQALVERVVGRTISGGIDMKQDVEGLIREENSSVLEQIRDGLARELAELEEL